MGQDLYATKIEQAADVLKEKDVDCWLLMERESGTTGRGDPSLNLVFPSSVVGLTCFLLTKEGEFYAVAAGYDVHHVESTGLFDAVFGYDKGVDEELLPLLREIDPQTIGVNYSQEDFTADGLSHGLYLKLRSLLAGSPWENRLHTAEDLVAAARGRKTELEVKRIKKASQTTALVWEALTEYLQPGISELDIMNFVHAKCDELDVETAWDRRFCPGLTAGPDSVPGHNAPSDDVVVEPGTLVSMDFGVKEDDYVCDYQRNWFIPSADEPQPPRAAVEAGEVVREAIMAAKEAMEPGVKGYEIDAIAREIIVEAGYAEYKHALGHQVGRVAHDGAGLLGPKDWPRYAEKSKMELEVGNVFTIEPGVMTDIGRYGGEEMVVVTEEGAEWLIEPQGEIWIAQGERT